MTSLSNPFLRNRATRSHGRLYDANPSATHFGLAFLLALLLFSGCLEPQPGAKSELDTQVEVLGKLGLGDSRFQKPRAIAVDSQGQTYIVDMTARIQVHSAEGKFIRSWRTPKFDQGKPCGLGISNDGLLMVADTHCYRVLFYTPEGELVEDRTLGGVNGRGPGEFGFVTDVVQDSQGNYYVSEYGDYDRIQKFDSGGNYLFEWGGHGDEPGQFLRPQGITLDANDHLWVADASNHRIQVFDATGTEATLIRHWGQMGRDAGQLSYPYDLFLDGRGHLYVCEFGNNRVQKFTLDGKSLGTWGTAGRDVGQLHQPWGMAAALDGSIHVLDSYNHRLQTFRWDQSADQPNHD